MPQAPKTDSEIQAMRDGGKILAQVFLKVREAAIVGVSGKDIDRLVEAEISRLGATPTYREPVPNFPGVICISRNEAIVHGVPTDEPFEQGDIVGFDLVISYNGMKVDSAFTMVIGEKPSGAMKHLLKETERSLYAGIDAIKGDGTRIGDISAAVEAVLSSARLGIVKELVGHGIGHEMHMPPEVPNYGRKGSGDILRAGDTIAIEPMASLGKGTVIGPLDDEWTYATKDGSLAAHFEHTVLITTTGAEIITQV